MSLLTTALAVPEPTSPAPGAAKEIHESSRYLPASLKANGVQIPSPSKQKPPLSNAHTNRLQQPDKTQGANFAVVKRKPAKKPKVDKSATLKYGSGHVSVTVMEKLEMAGSGQKVVVGTGRNGENESRSSVPSDGPGDKKPVYHRLLAAFWKLPGLDDIIRRVRENRYICTIFCMLLVCTTSLAVIVLVDPEPEFSDMFAALFGVSALVQVILGALLQVRNDEVTDIVSCFGFVTKDNNGIRAFMLLEASVDIAVGALSFSKPDVVPVASAAIALAVAAIAVLVVVPLCCDKEKNVYGYHMPVAVVLTDAADVLLLLRIVVLQVISAKDILLFVFLVLNVAVTELSTLVAIRAEETTEPPANEDNEERKERLQKAIKMRRAMRNKSLAQTVVTGTLIIPIMLAIILADFLESQVEVAFILLPMVSFFFRASESKMLCGRWFFRTRLNDSWRDLLPRVYVLTCALVLAAYDAALGLSYELQQQVFYAYTIYNLVPFVLRVLEDATQHQVNIITTRLHSEMDRETDTNNSKLFRSALADAIDNSNYMVSKEELRKLRRWDPSVAFAMYCKCDESYVDSDEEDEEEGDLGCFTRIRNKWKRSSTGFGNEKSGVMRDLSTLMAWSQFDTPEDRANTCFQYLYRRKSKKLIPISCLHWTDLEIKDSNAVDVLRSAGCCDITELW